MNEVSARLYGGGGTHRVTITDLAVAKERGERWPMLTAYDATTAQILDEAGIPVLLVGDSAATLVYGYDSTIPVTVDELLPLVRGVVRGSKRALVVADLPFGTYQQSVEQAIETIRRRVDALGVAEPTIQEHGLGDYQILVQLPGVDDPARVKLIQDAVAGSLKVPQKAYLWALRNPHLSAVISELVSADLVKQNLPLAAQKKPA